MLSILKRLHKFLYSIKLTLYLFFILTVTSMVGSVTTRSNLVKPPEDLSILGRIFKTYDLFHSWWFITIVSLFSVNLTLCIIHHFVPHLKKYFSKEIFNENAVKNPWITDKIILNSSESAFQGDTVDNALQKVKDFLKNKGYKIHETKRGIIAEKGRYSRLLPFLFHISLLIIIAGSLVGAVFGFVGTGNIHVDTENNEFYNWTELKDDKLDFMIRIDDFFLEYHPIPVTVAVKDTRKAGGVDLYEIMERDVFKIKDSQYKVQVLEAVLDKKFTSADFYFRLFKDDVPVGDFYDNEEIKDFPYDLYYPVLIEIGIYLKDQEQPIHIYRVPVGDMFKIPNTAYEIFVNGFGQLQEKENPSFHFALYKDGEKIGEYYGDENVMGIPYRFVLHAYKLPSFQERIPKVMRARVQIKNDGKIQKEGDVEVNHPLTYDDITFYETSYGRDPFGFMYIGFQIVKDPGVNIVYTGFILMFIAVMPIFFVSHKKVYVTHDEKSISLTGEATKNKKDFKEEFFNYAKEIKGT